MNQINNISIYYIYLLILINLLIIMQSFLTIYYTSIPLITHIIHVKIQLYYFYSNLWLISIINIFFTIKHVMLMSTILKLNHSDHLYININLQVILILLLQLISVYCIKYLQLLGMASIIQGLEVQESNCRGQCLVSSSLFLGINTNLDNVGIFLELNCHKMEYGVFYQMMQVKSQMVCLIHPFITMIFFIIYLI